MRGLCTLKHMNVLLIFSRMQITKHHPSSVDLELVKRLITQTRATNLTAFLTREFDQVSKALAGQRMHLVLIN